MNEYDTNDDSSDVECRWDGCPDTFGTTDGMKTHHALAHGESIAGVAVQCEWCGEEKTAEPKVAKEQDRHFCDQDCLGEFFSENRSGKDHPNWEGGCVAVDCEWCGEETEAKPHRVETRENIFCSYGCMGEWRSENVTGEDHPNWSESVTVACSQCGGTKEVTPSRARRSGHHFCDTKCMYEWRSANLVGADAPAWKGGMVEVGCSQCGEAKEVWQTVANEDRNRFCDHDCFAEWKSEHRRGEDNPRWAGGVAKYGSGWTDRLKERVRERQDRQCAGCGADGADFPRKLDVHHIQKARSFDDDGARNDDSNLVALCRQCHPDWEAMTPLRPQTPHLD